MSCVDVDAQSLGSISQAAHDAHGILRAWEYTFVLLRYQFDPLVLEPFIGILIVEASEETFHQLAPARIYLLEVSHFAKRIGQVASSATCYCHLGQNLLCPFVDIHRGVWQPLLHSDGSEESCRSTANDGNVHLPFTLCFLHTVAKVAHFPNTPLSPSLRIFDCFANVFKYTLWLVRSMRMPPTAAKGTLRSTSEASRALPKSIYRMEQMRCRCFMARQGSVPGRVELQGGNENGTCQLVMARPMMIGYRGMSIPRWRILVSGSWHRWRGQASACVR